MIQALGYIRYIGQRTYTADALDMLRTRIYNNQDDRGDAPNYAIVITDGNSNIDPARTIPSAIQVGEQKLIQYF